MNALLLRTASSRFSLGTCATLVSVACVAAGASHASGATSPANSIPPAGTQESVLPDTEPGSVKAKAEADEAAGSEAGEDAELDLDAIAKSATEDSLNRETRVATGTARRLQDTPGIVTVITRDDIRRLGPRDLMDLLHLVPGFSFGADVQGVVGPIVRGVWGQEGKVLVLWDGFEMNETMYLAALLENRFPLQAIDRIEIIRGPGSALYGGYAELAVINIVPRGADVGGLEAAATYGQMWRGFGRATGELVYGHRIRGGLLDGMELAVNAFGGEAARADRNYTDLEGNTFRMDWNNARQGPTWLSVSALWGPLQVRGLLDLYRGMQRDHYDVSLEAPISNYFFSAHLDVRYKLRFGNLVEIEPRINFKRQLPWYSGDDFLAYKPLDYLYYKFADRARFFLLSRWFLRPGVTLTAGFDGYGDLGTVVLNQKGEYDGVNGEFQNGQPWVVYGNVAALAELSVQSEVANLTAGARAEYHDTAGPSFVPRFALTRNFDSVWFKALVSGAFKPPGIENVSLAPKNDEGKPVIRPESATVYEAELGYDLSAGISLSAAVFHIEINNPILYSYVGDVESYANGARTGAEGAEVELRMVETWGSLDLTHSMTTSAGINEVETYDLGNGRALRGVPAHKTTAAGRFNLSGNLSLGPTLVVISERRGWLGAPDNKTETAPPAVLASINLSARDFLVDGLTANLAVHNILDADYRYIQPYDAGHAPLPASGREVMLRMAYRLED